jgi:hypothetical protein
LVENHRCCPLGHAAVGDCRCVDRTAGRGHAHRSAIGDTELVEVGGLRRTDVERCEMRARRRVLKPTPWSYIVRVATSSTQPSPRSGPLRAGRRRVRAGAPRTSTPSATRSRRDRHGPATAA